MIACCFLVFAGDTILARGNCISSLVVLAMCAYDGSCDGGLFLLLTSKDCLVLVLSVALSKVGTQQSLLLYLF
jgi:hypothetical protein